MINFKPYLLALNILVGISSISSLYAAWEPAEVISNPAIPIAQLNGPTLSVTPFGNAIAVWTDSFTPTFPSQTAISSSFYTQGIGWSAPQVISSLALNPFDGPLYTAQGDPDVRMNSSNYAVVAWEGEYSDLTFPAVIFGTIRQSNGTWGPVEVISEFDADFLAKNPNVAVNDAGTSAVVYRKIDFSGDPTVDYTMVTTLPFGGSWTAPISISSAPEESKGEGDSKPDIDINAAGDMVSVWYRRFSATVFGIDAATYNATTATWSPSVTLDTNTGDVFGENPKTSIDANGNAVAVWLNGTTIKASSFTQGIGWGANVVLDTSSEDGPEVIMDSAGNATATWTHLTFTNEGIIREIYSSSKPLGGVWSTPVVISTGTTNTVMPFQSQETLAVDLSGNVIAIWQSDVDTLMSAFRVLNQPWQAPEVVYSSDDPVNFESVGLASCGFAVALWSNTSDNTAMAAINGNLFAPNNANLVRCKQRFAMQKSFVNTLTWNSFFGSCILNFNIYCNNQLIGIIPSSAPYEFRYTRDCRNRCNYSITSVNIFGFESEPIPFILQ